MSIRNDDRGSRHFGWNKPSPDLPGCLNEDGQPTWNWRFDEPIYQRTFEVVYCPDAQWPDVLEKCGAPDSVLSRVTGSGQGATASWRGNDGRPVYMIWINTVPNLPDLMRESDPDFLGVLFHEALHAAMYVLGDVGALADDAGQETLTWYAEFVFRRVVYCIRERALDEWHADAKE